MSRTKNWWKYTSVFLVGGVCAATLAVFGRPAAGQETVEPTVAVTLDDPVVVAQAPPELNRAGGAWGRWQFPVITRLADGQLLARFAVLPDSAEYYGKPGAHAYSSDDGRTWRLGEPRADHEVEDGVLLPNGDRLKPVVLETRRAEDFDLPDSVCDFVDSYGYPRSLYRLEDLPKELVGWRFSRLPAGTSEWIEEDAVMRIPGELRYVVQEKPRSAPPGVGHIGQVRQGLLPLPSLGTNRRNALRVAPDQSLWGVYEPVRLFGETPLGTPVFLRSVDNGRTWDMLGEIRYQGDQQADPHAAKRSGFWETGYTFLPAGSVVCLLRTMDGNGHGPLYLVRSTDGARTWSKPVVFDTFGKWPQLLTLGNGVTLASYGASGGPGYYVVRATLDPSGQVWEPPVRTPVSPVVSGAWDTCGHTEMVPLDDRTALLVYSDFNYPDADGVPRKSILVRRIQVAIKAAQR